MTDFIERIPPHSEEAERAVLGSMLRFNDCIADVLGVVQQTHFYHAALADLFAVIVGLWDKGKPADLVTVADAFKDAGKIEPGTYSLLAELFDATPSGANAVYYAHIVKGRSIQRDLIHAGTEILRDSYDNAGPAEEQLETAEKKIFAIGEASVTAKALGMPEILAAVSDRIDERCTATGAKGVTTGLTDLDDRTGGWQPGELCLLAARPSAGKTALMLGFAAEAARSGCPVLIVSLEQPHVELGERLMVGYAQVNSHAVRNGNISEQDVAALMEAKANLAGLPVFIDDSPTQNYLKIAATTRRLKRRAGVGLVIIDYLQLIDPDEKRAMRHEQVASISRRLKQLARETYLPIICLAQLNRALEDRPDHRPRLSDLRESGALEADADVVILMHRPEMYNPLDRQGETDLIVAKQRNGPTGVVTVTFQKEFMRFQNYGGSGDAPVEI